MLRYMRGQRQDISRYEYTALVVTSQQAVME